MRASMIFIEAKKELRSAAVQDYFPALLNHHPDNNFIALRRLVASGGVGQGADQRAAGQPLLRQFPPRLPWSGKTAGNLSAPSRNGMTVILSDNTRPIAAL